RDHQATGYQAVAKTNKKERPQGFHRTPGAIQDLLLLNTAATLPLIFCPHQGEFFDFDLLVDSSSGHSAAGSSSVISAGSPSRITGTCRSSSLRGFVAIFSTSMERSTHRDNAVMFDAKVCRLMMPNAAWSNSVFLPSSSCGRCPLQITSMVPSFNPLMSAS